MKRGARPLIGGFARVVASLPSGELRRRLVSEIYAREVEAVFDAVAAPLHGAMTLADLEFDLTPGREVAFEELAGLFPSGPFTFGVSQMSPRQLGYIFGLARRDEVRRVLEVGRYKGGSTLVLAAAVGQTGMVWSIDDGSVTASKVPLASHDTNLVELCSKLSLNVRLLTGDSRTLTIDTDSLDMVLIDADHSYDGAKADFNHWSPLIRPRGHLLFDDAFESGRYQRHSGDIGRVVKDAEQGGFQLVARVDRLAHLQRTGA